MNGLTAILFVIFAPIVGGLLSGIDRKISARMQGRYGPPILQPFYDVMKLLSKETAVINQTQNYYIFLYFAFMVFTGALFFSGGDLLLVVFIFTLASVFLVLGGYSTSSPYSSVGSDRELLQMMAYEPMVLLMAVGMYMVTDSFHVGTILKADVPAIVYIPGVFLGFIYILTIKLRKSPFDLSTSHHAHQEIVKGITTEYGGPSLAFIEMAHWYENVMLLGFIYLFFASTAVYSIPLGIFACAFVYFLEILIDNSNARVKWQQMLKSSWLVTIILGFINLVILSLM